MITVKKALDQLVASGLVASWKKVSYKEYNFKVTGFEVETDKFGFGNETYGCKSVIFFRCKSPEIAREAFKSLRLAGGSPSNDWNGGIQNGCVMMQVSKFKGHHYYE